jgi:transposase
MNLRVKNGKPSGRQLGHGEHTPVLREEADEIIEHIAGYCQGCGHSLETVTGVMDCHRQEVEIPVGGPTQSVFTDKYDYELLF